MRFLDLVSPFQKWLPEIISPERKVPIATSDSRLTVLGPLPTTRNVDRSHASDISCALTGSAVRNCLGRFCGSVVLAENDFSLKSRNGTTLLENTVDGIVNGVGDFAYCYFGDDHSDACRVTTY